MSFANSAKHAEARNAAGVSNFKGVPATYKGNAPQPRNTQVPGRGGAGRAGGPPVPGRGNQFMGGRLAAGRESNPHPSR